jgi:hypothetical protein
MIKVTRIGNCIVTAVGKAEFFDPPTHTYEELVRIREDMLRTKSEEAQHDNS